MKKEITIIMEQGTDLRESTHTIVNGKEVHLATDCLPSLVERDTALAVKREFGENIVLVWKF